jgi:hypothetical protein
MSDELMQAGVKECEDGAAETRTVAGPIKAAGLAVDKISGTPNQVSWVRLLDIRNLYNTQF